MYILKRFEKLAFHREIVNQTFDDLEYDFQLRNIRMFCLHDNEAVVIELNHDGLSFTEDGSFILNMPVPLVCNFFLAVNIDLTPLDCANYFYKQ